MFVKLNWVVLLFSISLCSYASSSIELELESYSDQALFPPFTIEFDSSASNQAYVIWPDQSNSAFVSPSDDSAGQIAIPFNLTETADVTFQLRADMVGANNDSIFYRLDSAPWSTKNNIATSGWQDINVQTFSNVSSGHHVLYLSRREDGAKLDSVNLQVSAGSIHSESSITVELEAFSWQSNFAPFEAQTDSNGGVEYVVWPNGNHDAFLTPTNNSAGQIAVTFSLSAAADVALSINADLPNASDDSFFYKLNNENWHTQNNLRTIGWQTFPLQTFSNVSAGTHTVYFSIREDGAKLDNIRLNATKGLVKLVETRVITRNPLRRNLSPTSPMYLVHVSYNVDDEPLEVIDAIPADIRPYVVLNLNPAGTEIGSNEGYELMKKWLEVALQHDMWAMVQPSAGIRNRMDDMSTVLYEKLYQDFPNLIGYNWSEQTWGYDEQSFYQRLNLLADLIEISAEYGGFIYINDAMSISQPGWNTIAKFKKHPRFLTASKSYSKNVIYGNKTTHGWGYFDNESMALGAFLGGYADHYAIRYDQYSWVWSGKAKLFGEEGSREEMEQFGSLTWFTSPEALMGTHIAEHLMLTGATVIDGPEVEWASAIFRGEQTPNFKNVMVDVLRKVIDGTIVIPSRQDVAARTKVALISDGNQNNTPEDLYTGLYLMDNDGEHKYNRHWLKKTGRFPTIPYLVDPPTNSEQYERVVKQSDYQNIWASETDKIAVFEALFPQISSGDMFIANVENNWLAYNPNINEDRSTNGSFNLAYNSCSSVDLTFAPHTFAVIQEQTSSLNVYLNNYRTDKRQLWDEYPEGFSSWRLQNYVLPDFILSPTDETLRQSTIVLYGCDSLPQVHLLERGEHQASTLDIAEDKGTVTLTIQHNGPIDLMINDAFGNNANRKTPPATVKMRRPYSPSIAMPRSISGDPDNDGVDNLADTDDDGDGVADSNDYLPLNPVIGVLGDFDGDQDVDAMDIRIFSISVRTEELHSAYDLNQDGVVNRRDSRFLTQLCTHNRCEVQ
ncbi:glycoside hydrolase family 98 domain-containing protein [Catenovulum adriaticum]|uniref:Dockerin domain-containing protein n=1 Tax=Catenovulum adriaticum TaxID=2984846 RepID=A0ABY7AU63_9ALTE|nr:glycoside hydrolase family 98 domain-containing protein [Catenovulum sp. TS8]WAJ71899.1 hypothetical protein OLW01_14315 [Catenovulum sp. TS8]